MLITFYIEKNFFIIGYDLCLFKNPCKNGGSCRFINDTLACDCPAVYTGNYCETSLCEVSAPCENNGVCMIANGSSTDEPTIKCTCMPGFFGDFCELSKLLFELIDFKNQSESNLSTVLDWMSSYKSMP